MTVEEEVIVRVIRHLDALGIPYMIAGSVASSFHGRPRATHDADIVIDPDPEALERLVQELSAAGFYADPNSAREALRRRRQFNVIDTASAFKLDLIIRKDRPFSHAEFARRQRADLPEAKQVALATDSLEARMGEEGRWVGAATGRRPGHPRCQGRRPRPRVHRTVGQGSRRPGTLESRDARHHALRRGRAGGYLHAA